MATASSPALQPLVCRGSGMRVQQTESKILQVTKVALKKCRRSALEGRKVGILCVLNQTGLKPGNAASDTSS